MAWTATINNHTAVAGSCCGCVGHYGRPDLIQQISLLLILNFMNRSSPRICGAHLILHNTTLRLCNNQSMLMRSPTNSCGSIKYYLMCLIRRIALHSLHSDSCSHRLMQFYRLQLAIITLRQELSMK